MKQKLQCATLLLVGIVGLLLAGCMFGLGELIVGSGEVVTQEMGLHGFDRVEVSHEFQVEIRQGEPFQVVVQADEKIVPHLQVITQGNTLHIGLEPMRLFRLRNITLRAQVTMPKLTGLEASGASNVTLTGFQSANSLTIKVSGASTLGGDITTGDANVTVSGASTVDFAEFKMTEQLDAEISGASTWSGALTAGDTSLKVSGASKVTAQGAVQAIQIEATGASHVDLSGCPVTDANVEASGASTITVKPSGRLDAAASGASHVYYLGEPTLGRVDTSGASSVSQR